MKRKIMSKIAAWLAAVSMIASPAGVNIAGVTVMAVEEASVTSVSEETTAGEAVPTETTVTDVPTDTETPVETTVPTETESSESTVTTPSDGDVTEETAVPETEASETETTPEETEVTEETSETEEEEEEDEPESYHYVSPNGDACMPAYEYWYFEYEEEDVPENSISCVRAPSYFSAQSNYSSTDGYNVLTETQKEVYNSIYEALVIIDNSSAYSATYNAEYGGYFFEGFKIAEYSVDSQELFKIFVAIRNDNPQFFWLGHSYLYGGNENITNVYFGLDDNSADYASGSKRMSVKNAIMSEVENVLDQAEIYGNEYSKEWFIHNYLCEKTEYVSGATHAHDISGLLVDEKAVCEAYAKSFQLFMNALDIDVLYVTGTGNGGGHAWNQVGLDNNGVTEWYNVDVTWDDNTNGFNYNYFNAVDSDGSYYDFTYGPDATYRNDHVPEDTSSLEYIYPVKTCNSTTYSYGNHDTNFKVSGGFVAQIGTKMYVTLDAAISAVSANDTTIKLLADAVYNGRTMPAYDFTIDGGGYSLTFNSDMKLNSDVTIKNIRCESFNYVLDNEENWYFAGICTGANTLTIGECTGDYFPACLYGEETGSLVFDEAETEYGVIYISEFKNVTIPDNTNVHSRHGVYATNLALGNNSCLAIDFNEVGCVNYNGTATSSFAITSNNQYAGVSIEGTINAPIVNVYAANVNYESEWALILSTKNYSVDMFNIVNTAVEPNVNCGVRKYGPNGDGNYLYYPTPSADYTITDGTKTVKRSTFEEAVNYITEAAKSTATYTITYTGSDDTVYVNGSAFNTAKAKEIIFEGISVSIIDDLSLKTNITFKSGAFFNGNITTGAYVLKLADSDSYKISCAVTGAKNITLDNAELIIANADEANEITVKVENLVLTNNSTVNSNAENLDITKLTMSGNSFIGPDEGGRITINSVVSTGSNTIKAADVPVIIKGTITLTDGTPINVAATDNIASSGQTALVVENSYVKASSFTTNAKTSDEKALSLIRDGNEIKFAAPAFEVVGLGKYAIWEDVLAAINAAGSAEKEFTVNILSDVVVSNLTLPAASKAKSIIFDGSGELTLTQATLAIPVNTEFVCLVNAQNTNVTVAAGKTLTVNSVHFKSITGTATSVLNKTNYSALAVDGDIKNFKEVNIISGYIYLLGNMSAVQNMGGGTLRSYNSNANLTINNISSTTTITMVSDVNGKLPKLTVNAIADNANLNITINSGDPLPSGTTILYAPKDITDKITITNTTETGKKLDPFYYTATKSIKAEYSGVATLSANGETVGNYPNLESIFAEITSRRDNTAGYTITLNENVSASAFAIPTYAEQIDFVGKDGAKTITLNNLTAVTANVNLVFENITLESSKPFTLTANKNLRLSGFASESMTALRGNAKFILEWGTNNTLSVPVSGFGTVTIMANAVMTTAATANFTELSMDANAKLIVPSSSKVTIKDIMAVPSSAIYYEDGFTPVSITGKAEGTVTFTGANRFTDGQLLFTSSAANLACFKVAEENWPDDTYDYTVSRTGSNVYLRSVKIVLSDGENVYQMATWADVISSINAANNKTATYVIALLGNYDIDGAMTMPKAGTYEALNITSANDPYTGKSVNANLTFVGTAITLTGNTMFTDIEVSALRKSGTNYVPVAYNITAGSNQLWLENVSGNITNITSTNNVFLDGTDVAGNVNAKNMLITDSAVMGNVTLTGNFTIGTNAVVGENLTADQITSLDSESSNLTLTYGKKFTIGKTGFANAEKLTVRFVETKGEEMCVEVAIGEVIGSITGDYYGNIVINDSPLHVVRSGNNLVAVAGAMYVLDDGTNETMYLSLKDVMTEITRIGNKNANYEITLSASETITGAFPLPAANKYHSITFKPSGEDVTLSLTGDITLTGNVWFMGGVHVEKINAKTNAPLPININVGAYTFTTYNYVNVGNVNGAKGIASFWSDADVSGNINVAELNIGGEINLSDKSSLTATKIYSSDDTTLVYPYKNAAKVKVGTFIGDPLTVKLMDGISEYAYPADKVFDVMNITGDYEKGMVVLNGQSELSVVRSVNKLVAGNTADMIKVTYGDFNSSGDWTNYELLFANLKDVMTEINRRNKPDVNYIVYINNDMSITGALPLPAVGKYAGLWFWTDNENGVTLTLTGDITMTGELYFEKGVNVKKVNAKGDDLPININVGKYKFLVYEFINVNNVNGVQGTAYFGNSANISGTVNVNELTIGGTVTLGNTASITANELNVASDTVLVYPYKSAAKVKVGTFTGSPLTVKLMDGDEEYDYPTDTIFDVMNITGDYVQGKVKINGHNELSVVRSGNKLVAGKTADMIELSDGSLYASLKDVMTEINRRNDPNAYYTVYINNDMPITGALPLPAAGKYNEIDFRTENANGVTLSLTGDITMTGDLYFAEGVTVKKVNDQPINVNVGAYNFWMNESFNAGNINGAKGFVALYCDANISGTVNADSLYIDGIITLGNTASITANYLDAFSDTVLVYPYKNAAKVKVGTFTGNPDSILTVKLMDGDEEYDYPTDTIFDVMNITGDYEQGKVKINGHNELSVVRSGNKLVAGETAKMAKLADGSLYASLNDIMTEINRRNDPNANYTVYISNDMTITGALPLPAAGKYSEIWFDTDNENGITLSLTGDITLTGYLKFYDNVNVKKVNDQPININVGKYELFVQEFINVNNVNGAQGVVSFMSGAKINGTVNVNLLYIYETVTLGNTAIFTVNELNVGSDTVLVYPYKSVARVKIGTFDEYSRPLTVKLMDGDEEYDYPVDKTFDVMNITGDYEQDIVVINGHDDELSVVRSGNKLIAGKTADMIEINGDGSLYASLKDVMTEINRRNKPNVDYIVYINNDMTITGALPLPAAGKYKRIHFQTENENGVTLTLTGDITMTGELYFGYDVNVKKINATTKADLPININVGKYELLVDEFIIVNNVNGAQGDVWFDKDVKISGTVNVNRLYIYETVTLGNTASLTANELYAESGATLEYPYKSAARVKVGTLTGYSLTVKLVDANGNLVTLTEADAGKVLMAKCGNINKISLENALPEGYVLATTSTGALIITLSTAVVEVNSVKYASLDDAIDSTAYADTLAVLEEVSTLFTAA